MRVLAERDGRTAVLNTLGPGAVIGELALLPGAQRSASVQALREIELLEIDGERFEELILETPSSEPVSRELSQSASSREAPSSLPRHRPPSSR